MWYVCIYNYIYIYIHKYSNSYPSHQFKLEPHEALSNQNSKIFWWVFQPSIPLQAPAHVSMERVSHRCVHRRNCWKQFGKQNYTFGSQQCAVMCCINQEKNLDFACGSCSKCAKNDQFGWSSAIKGTAPKLSMFALMMCQNIFCWIYSWLWLIPLLAIVWNHFG